MDPVLDYEINFVEASDIRFECSLSLESIETISRGRSQSYVKRNHFLIFFGKALLVALFCYVGFSYLYLFSLSVMASSILIRRFITLKLRVKCPPPYEAGTLGPFEKHGF
ncbi:hypothetical protein OUZ56_031219 [Daphnia magna]|uniref:Uncharacterized protein n=1 Tax=Daphnia magna TaxID=35525 RepID=A0ABQ9ZUS7_9CRUS|nr:hypothetical protein OUZ56_031219 [Daphnia magna]